MSNPTSNAPVFTEEAEHRIQAKWNFRSFVKAYSSTSQAFEVILTHNPLEIDRMLSWPDLQYNLTQERWLQNLFQNTLKDCFRFQDTVPLDVVERIWDLMPSEFRFGPMFWYWMENTTLEDDPYKHWFFTKMSAVEMMEGIGPAVFEVTNISQYYLETVVAMDKWMATHLAGNILKNFDKARIDVCDNHLGKPFSIFEFPETRAKAQIFLDQLSFQENLPQASLPESLEIHHRKKKL